MINTVLPGALRANARGLYACEAAVGLLINHRYWLTRPDFTGEFVDTQALTGALSRVVQTVDPDKLPAAKGKGAPAPPKELRDDTR